MIAFQLVLGKWTSAVNSLSGCWRLNKFSLGIEIAAHCVDDCDYLFNSGSPKFSNLLTYRTYVLAYLYEKKDREEQKNVP